MSVKSPVSNKNPYLHITVILLVITVLLSIFLVMLYATDIGKATEKISLTQIITQRFTSTVVVPTTLSQTILTTMTETFQTTIVTTITTTSTSMVGAISTKSVTKTTTVDFTHDLAYQVVFGAWGTPSSYVLLVTTDQHKGQVFYLHDKVKILTINIVVRRSSGSGGTLRLKIMSDNNGVPGTVIAQADVSASSIPTTFTTISFDFTPGVTLNPGKYYLIAVSTGSAEYQWREVDDTVPGSSIKSLDGGVTWELIPPRDAWFQIEGWCVP